MYFRRENECHQDFIREGGGTIFTYKLTFKPKLLNAFVLRIDKQFFLIILIWY